MATRIRNELPGKEKTLPRQANPEQRRTSPNPSPSPSQPVGPKSRPSPSDKNAPRPTRSGPSGNPPTQSAAARKPASSEKPSIAGRRSVKTTPLASQSSKTLQPPNPKDKEMRTSSFSGSRATGTTTQRGVSNRIIKTAPKDVVKKQSLTRPLSLKNRSATIQKTGESATEDMCSSVMSSPDRLPDPEIVDVPRPQEDDRQSSRHRRSEELYTVAAQGAQRPANFNVRYNMLEGRRAAKKISRSHY